MVRGVIWTMFAIWTQMAVARSYSSSSGMSGELPRRLEPAEFHLALPFDRGRPAAYFRIGL